MKAQFQKRLLVRPVRRPRALRLFKVPPGPALMRATASKPMPGLSGHDQQGQPGEGGQGGVAKRRERVLSAQGRRLTDHICGLSQVRCHWHLRQPGPGQRRSSCSTPPPSSNLPGYPSSKSLPVFVEAAAVKGGQRPSRSDLPLTAASTAAEPHFDYDVIPNS